MLKPHLIYQLLFRTCSKQILFIFHQIREKLQFPLEHSQGQEGGTTVESLLPASWAALLQPGAERGDGLAETEDPGRGQHQGDPVLP